MYYINGRDEQSSNWMRYVNCSRVEEEQNMIAYQFQGNIFYRVYKQVEAGTEFLVWYGEEYARELDIALEPMECKKPFICPVCGSEFTQKGTQKRHMAVHTGERLCVCEVCDKKCRDKHQLKLHMRTHTKEKPYSCRHCDYTCSHRHSLTYHLRTHTGEKPYVCDVCDKSFARLNTLRDHQQIHNKEKQFKCDQCGKRFSQKSSVRRHLMTTHSK